MNIDMMFHPRGVAVVGSVTQGKIGYHVIVQLLEGGFRQVYAVNPKAKGILSARGFSAVAHIDQPVDLVVIATPAPTVREVLEDCGQARVPAAIILTAGFSEVGNLEGEEEIVRTARRYGIHFIGPNCAGLIDTHFDLFPTLEVRPPKGEVSFLSQSGALGGVVLSWAEEQGVGISKFISYGNGADLNEIHFLEYLREDPETKVAALYCETISDGRAFLQAARDFTARKPLVVIKSGRSQAGQRATLSHTGSMAGQDIVHDAVLRECGAIRVPDVEAMFDLCKGFVYLPPVKGRRLAIVTNSGGPGVLAADRAEQSGLLLPEPTPSLRDELAAGLPATCSLKNPFDLTVEATGEQCRKALTAVLREYDAALMINVSPAYLDPIPLAEGICAARQEADRPIVASFMAGKPVKPSLPYLRAGGVPNYATGERAATVLGWMADFEERKASRFAAQSPPAPIGCLPGRGRPLEPQVMEWLRENHIPVLDFRFASSQQDAVRDAQALGYPVVMKVVSRGILHKSDVGGVILGIQNEQDVLYAYRSLQGVGSGEDFQGVILYPLVRGAVEALVGLTQDPQFGPVVVFGLGGIHTEVLHDISVRVAPVDGTQARAMIAEIRAFPILKGIRGERPRDVDALADLLVAVSRLPFLYPDLRELDLNPVFLLPEGLVVGDARLIGQEGSGVEKSL